MEFTVRELFKHENRIKTFLTAFQIGLLTLKGTFEFEDL